MMRGILAGLIQAPKAQKTVARCEREALSAWLLKSKDGRAPEAREEINRSDSVVFRPYRAPMSLLGVSPGASRLRRFAPGYLMSRRRRSVVRSTSDKFELLNIRPGLSALVVQSQFGNPGKVQFFPFNAGAFAIDDFQIPQLVFFAIVKRNLDAFAIR